jgi:periplasmic divalent cation tolerance protein
MTDAIQVITTLGSRQQADKLARELVVRRLAACVQVAGPITSTYRWQGKIETSQEWFCIIKSLESKYAALEAAIRELHPYDVPEIMATSVVAASRDYLDWLFAELDDGPEHRIV